MCKIILTENPLEWNLALLLKQLNVIFCKLYGTTCVVYALAA